jgi:hypothetical protein
MGKKYESHFLIENIREIQLTKERPAGYIWIDEKIEIIKKWYWFGFYKKEIKTEAGFYEKGYEHYAPHTEQYFLDMGYKIYPISERIENRICSKAYVTLSWKDGGSRGFNFESDDEAKAWIEQIKVKSGKTFEVIEY